MGNVKRICTDELAGTDRVKRKSVWKQVQYWEVNKLLLGTLGNEEVEQLYLTHSHKIWCQERRCSNHTVEFFSGMQFCLIDEISKQNPRREICL